MVPTRNGISGDPQAALSRPHHYCLKCISAISFTTGRFEGAAISMLILSIIFIVGGLWEYKCLCAHRGAIVFSILLEST